MKLTVLGESYIGGDQDGSLEPDCSPPGFDNADEKANDHADAECLQLPSEAKFATLVKTLTLNSSCLHRVQNGKVRGATGGSRIFRSGRQFKFFSENCMRMKEIAP